MTTTTTALKTCPKCNGTGHLAHLAHVDGGVCFECDGAGSVESTRTTRTVARRPLVRVDSLTHLRAVYASTRRAILDGASVAILTDAHDSHLAETILALYAEIPADKATTAAQAFAALGLDRETLEYAAQQAREIRRGYAR
jgi:DnaJ-class molecular chaperone